MKNRIVSYLVFFSLVSLQIYSCDRDDKNKYGIKTYISPSGINSITSITDYDSIMGDFCFVYFTDGGYKKQSIPENGNFIKYPNKAKVVILWESDQVCNIYSNSKPEINKFRPNNYKLNLIYNKYFGNDTNEVNKLTARGGFEPDIVNMKEERKKNRDFISMLSDRGYICVLILISIIVIAYMILVRPW